MYNIITTASPGYLGVPPHDATATGGSMRPGPQATSRRAPTLQARHAAPGASGTEAQLVSSAPGQGRARHDPGLFIVMPARGKTTVLMRTSGN